MRRFSLESCAELELTHSSFADNAGNTSTVSVQSTATSYVNATDAVTIVPSIVSNSAAGTSVVLQTVGGATVTAPGVTVSAATTQVMITVSETVDPSELFAFHSSLRKLTCEF